MSKHAFDQTVGDTTYDVQIGWDKPTVSFYFNVSVIGDNGEIGTPVASNLYLPAHHCLTLKEIEQVLEDFGIVLPSGLLQNVENDRINNAVNQFHVYNNNKDGSET